MFRKKITVLLLMPFFVLVVLILGSEKVHAVSKDDVMKKWVFTQYYNCFNQGALKMSVRQVLNEKVVDSLFNDGYSVAMPSLGFDGVQDEISCKDLFIGGGTGGLEKGVLDYAGLSEYREVSWSDSEASGKFLNDLGYNGSDIKNTESLVITFDVFSLKNVNDLSTSEKIGEYSSNYFNPQNEDGVKYGDYLTIIKNGDKVILEPRSDIGTCHERGEAGFECPTNTFNYNEDLGALAGDIEEKIINTSWIFSKVSGAGTMYSFNNVKVESEKQYEYGVAVEGYMDKRDRERYTILQRIALWTGWPVSTSSLDSMLLDSAETYVLYEYYLREGIEDGQEIEMTYEQPSSLNNVYKIFLKDSADGKVKECYILYAGESWLNKQVNAQVRGDSGAPAIEVKNMRYVLEWLGSKNNVNDETLKDVGQTIDTIGTVDTCMNTGAAGSLGWVICPVLDWLANGANWVYDTFIEKALQIEPQLFTDKGDNTRIAWATFQSFANIVFIILFLVVIFSQLTGVGIDNYGIKKILPKLIVAAILINLSYLICTVLIDLSNIIGNAFKALFDGLGNFELVDSIEVSAARIPLYPSKGKLTGLAVLISLMIGVWSLASDGAGFEGIVLALVVAALGIAVGVLFLFLILAAREAAIVVLTVISPLAFACIILPNTKKLFDKWLKMGEGLLLVYPICGLMIGAGNYVSNLLLSSGMANNGFLSAFVAMIVSVVPIFFIPFLIKNSFQAMGNIGTKISGFGKTLGGKLQGSTDKVWKSSAGYKARSERRNNDLQLKNDLKKLDLATAEAKRGAKRNRKKGYFQILDKNYDELSGFEKMRYRRRLSQQHRIANAHQVIEAAEKRRLEDKNMGGEDQHLGRMGRIGVEAYGASERDRLYAKPGIAESRKSQINASIGSEIKKGYTEQYKNVSADDRSKVLKSAIAGKNDKGENMDMKEAVELMDSLSESLIEADVDKVLETLSEFSTNDLTELNPKMQDRLFMMASRSGHPILKAWGKINSTQKERGGYLIGLKEYALAGKDGVKIKKSDGEIGDENGLLSYLAEEVGLESLNNAKKETVEWLSKVDRDVAKRLDPRMAAEMIASPEINSNARSIKAFKTIVGNMEPSERDKMQVTVEGFTRIKDPGLVEVLNINNLMALKNELDKPENALLLAKVNSEVRKELERITSSLKPSNNSGVNPQSPVKEQTRPEGQVQRQPQGQVQPQAQPEVQPQAQPEVQPQAQPQERAQRGADSGYMTFKEYSKYVNETDRQNKGREGEAFKEFVKSAKEAEKHAGEEFKEFVESEKKSGGNGGPSGGANSGSNGAS